MSDFKRNGLYLEGAEFDAVVGLKRELSKLSTEFMTNCNEDATQLLISTGRTWGSRAEVRRASPTRSRTASIVVAPAAVAARRSLELSPPPMTSRQLLFVHSLVLARHGWRMMRRVDFFRAARRRGW
jgi:hypothetical protein